MIRNGKAHCDSCGRELRRLSEEECLEDIIPHGWTDWRTAYKHYCYECPNELWDPPCGICETQPCHRGSDCWATPPLHLFPYETYYAENIPWTENWRLFEKWAYTKPLESYFMEALSR